MVKKFVIDRSKWRCGGVRRLRRGKGVTRLLNEDGHMCCLGQICKQLGVEEKQMLGIGSPQGMDITDPALQEALEKVVLSGVRENSGLARYAVDINDSSETSDKQREKRLKDLFESHGFEIEFTGDYVR